MTRCKTVGCASKKAQRSGYCKSCEEKLDQNPEFHCKICSKTCTWNQNAIQCELCEKWSHIGCVNISNEKFEALSEIPGSKWFCEICVPVVNSKIIGHLNLEVQARELKGNIQDLKNVKNQFENLHEKLEKTTKNFE